MGRDPLFWCGNLAIRRRPRPSRWGCLSPALTAAPCTPGLATAIYRLDAFPSGLPWQDIVLMRSRRGLGREKASSWQHIACMYSNTANFGKICVSCIQKAPQSAAGEYAARTSCHQGGVFAVRSPQIMHGAQILPSSDELGPCAGMTTPAPRQYLPPAVLPMLRQCSPSRRSQRSPLCFCTSFRSVASLRQCPVP